MSSEAVAGGFAVEVRLEPTRPEAGSGAPTSAPNARTSSAKISCQCIEFIGDSSLHVILVSELGVGSLNDKE